jgi:hypothetical protein
MEVIVKKEKHDDGGYMKVLVSSDERPRVPEIVLKDGRVQIALPCSEDNERENRRELEIVKPEKKKVTTSTSFKKINHTEKWTEKETEKFYRALELFGTDFSMIARVFKNRNRNQIKNKFLREEKLAPEKVNDAFKEAQASNFQRLFKKFEKLKRTQLNTHAKYFQEKTEKTNKGLNLLKPLENYQQIQEVKQEDFGACIGSRNGRSGSFDSSVSIDSLDEAIMEDLADILAPKRI